MTVPTSYPGVYIQELPSLVHTITPAPTSVAVFVGYTHPFGTQQFGTAIQLFSFADYQANFGGFFSSPWQPDYVGQAVYQFFLNGGQTCYVVGLQATQYYTYSGSPPELTADGLVVPASVDAGGITFTALQPVGSAGTGGIAMQVAISNVKQTSSPDDTADIVISYGTTVETYRNVVRARPWKASGCTDRATGADAVRYTSVACPPGPPTARGLRRHQTDTDPHSNPSDSRLS